MRAQKRRARVRDTVTVINYVKRGRGRVVSRGRRRKGSPMYVIPVAMVSRTCIRVMDPIWAVLAKESRRNVVYVLIVTSVYMTRASDTRVGAWRIRKSAST